MIHAALMLGALSLTPLGTVHAQEAEPPVPAALIGKTLPPLPAGLDEMGGNCIGDCTYSIGAYGQASSADRHRIMLFIGGVRVPTSGPSARWRVLDAITAPSERPGYSLLFGVCRYQHGEDNAIVAQARTDDAERLEEIVWASRFDTRSGKFVPLDHAQVDCYNEAYLAD